jgi:hypothetical protein
VSHRFRIAWFFAVSALLGANRLDAQGVQPGWSIDHVTIAPPGAIVGGFEVLANGDFAVFDGTSVVELSPADGSLVTTLFTPKSLVYGTFLTLSPDQSRLYFGESTEGNVYEIDLATLKAPVVLTTVFPYDLAFDPQGRPFLSYALGFSGGSFVALCDFSNGALDDVIASPDASGPLVFDAAGNLYTSTPDTSSFPPPPDSTEVLRFSAGDVQSGIGAGMIGVDLGSLIGTTDGASSIALDEDGDVEVSDPNNSNLVEFDAATSVKSVLATTSPFTPFLYIRQVHGTRGAFEPWQPADAGELLAVRSDFFSFNELDRVRPARPLLSTNPASPIAAGPFTLDVSGAVPNGFGLLLLAPAGVAGSETPLGNRSWPAPLFFGLDLSAGLQLFPITTDFNGAAAFNAVNPGLGGFSFGLQLVAATAVTGPYFGTSAPLEVVLQ